jgi:hypothetical protein
VARVQNASPTLFAAQSLIDEYSRQFAQTYGPDTDELVDFEAFIDDVQYTAKQ